MDIISINTIIKEKDRVDGVLTPEYIFQAESNFAKVLLDFINEGNVIRIKSFETIENENEYICSSKIVIKKTLDKKGRLKNITDINTKLQIKNNKIIMIRKPRVKQYDVVGDEKDVM